MVSKHSLFTFLAVVAAAAYPVAAADLPSAVAIAPPGEPGERLIVTGVVVGPGGEPAAEVEIYAYHTDVEGYYSGTTTDSSDPRLAAHLQTDAEGRYEIDTIRPGAYPTGGPPAHIHYVFKTKASEERHDVYFAGDPRLTGPMIERSRAAGRFGAICELEKVGGKLHCERNVRLRQ